MAQQNPLFYLQTLIYVLEDIMMTTTTITASSFSTSDNDDNDPGDRNTRSNDVIVTSDEIRQFKDILKGYCLEDNSNQVPNSLSSTNSPSTLLQYLFQMVMQIFEFTIQNLNFQNDDDKMDDPDGAIILLSIKTISILFTWTTMEFLGSLHVLTQMFQVTIYTVQKYIASNYTTRYDIMKATFNCWKEFVTSCNMLPPASSSPSLSSRVSHKHQEQQHSRRHVEATSSIQSLTDSKLPILRRIVDCINGTQFLPKFSGNPQNFTIHNTSSIPNLVTISPDNTDESSVSADTMESIISMATLINTIALEIMPLYEHEIMETNITTTSETTANLSEFDNLFQQVFDLSIRTFMYDDIDVSVEILPFVVRLSYYMNEESGSDDHISRKFIHYLPLLLHILYQQMKYPIDFCYRSEENDDDDEAAEEIMFRTELCHVYKKLVSAAPSTCLEFLKELLRTIPTTITTNTTTTLNLAAASTPDIEAVLRLLYVFCEAIRPAPGLKAVMQNEVFRNILLVLHQSNITQHSHQEVLCLYYENSVRYYPFFLSPEHGDWLSKLLNSMTSASGLQHPHPHVRSRCCFLLLKLVQVTITLLTPYVETAVTGILSLLNNTGLLLRTDDTLYLFETIGLLLGKTGLAATQQSQFLGAVIAPHVQTIESVLTSIEHKAGESRSSGLQENDDTLGENCLILSNSIAAITNLSKGFTKPNTEVAILLTETLHITLRVLQKLPSSDQVRNKSMVLLQRMIVCVGQNVLVTIPLFLQLLVQWATCDDILFVAQLMNQLCIKFKQNTIPAIDGALVPFLEKCQSLVPALHNRVHNDGNSDLPPHLETEQLAIQKLSFIVLHHIVTHQVTGVLFSSINIGHLEAMLRLMHGGVISISDLTVKKTCLRFFRALIEQTNSIPMDTAESRNRYEHGILVYVGENVIPSTLQVLVTSVNRRQYVSDANGARVTAELGQLMNTFRKICDTDDDHKKMYQTSITKSIQSVNHHDIDVDLFQQQLLCGDNANDFVQSIQTAITQ
jgi:exportin-T